MSAIARRPAAGRRAAAALALVLARALMAPIELVAQSNAQRADIFIAPLSVRDDRPAVGQLIKVNEPTGFAYQPAFTADSRSLLFTVTPNRVDFHAYRYDIASKSTTRVTKTAEPEYSPSVIPGGERVSLLREIRGVTRIGRRRMPPDITYELATFSSDGPIGRLPLPWLRALYTPMVWLDAKNVALYGYGRPTTLLHLDTRTGKADTLAFDIGRSLAALPDLSGFSFTHPGDSTDMLAVMRWPSKVRRDVIPLPKGARDVVWLSADEALVETDYAIMYWRTGASTWTQVADYKPARLWLSGLTVSPDGKWLALSAIPSACPQGPTSFFEAFGRVGAASDSQPETSDMFPGARMPTSCVMR